VAGREQCRQCQAQPLVTAIMPLAPERSMKPARSGAASASSSTTARVSVSRTTPAIEYADRITIEAWVNTLSWPTRAVVCGKFDVQKYVGERSAWFLRDERLAAANPQASLGRTVRTLQMNVSNDAM
jgi:hypothetical protein